MIEKYIAIALNRLITRPFLTLKLGKVGRNFKLGYGSIINFPEKVSLGDDFYAGPFFYLSTNTRTSIEVRAKVMFGPGCKVIAGNHNMSWSGGHMMDAPDSSDDKGIIIEDGVWFGSNSMVLDGAVVGEGSVIAAGSVVVGRVPPYVVAMGVPARKFRRRFDDQSLLQILESTNSTYSLESVSKEYEAFGIDNIESREQ